MSQVSKCLLQTPVSEVVQEIPELLVSGRYTYPNTQDIRVLLSYLLFRVPYFCREESMAESQSGEAGVRVAPDKFPAINFLVVGACVRAGHRTTGVYQ
jgi:hypothetical protein